MGKRSETGFVRAVKRAFGDALVMEIRRAGLRRGAAAASGNVTRAYLQLLLKAERHASLGTFISLAEGLGMRPEDLITRTMENLSRIRNAESSPGKRPSTSDSADSSD